MRRRGRGHPARVHVLARVGGERGTRRRRARQNVHALWVSKSSAARWRVSGRRGRPRTCRASSPQPFQCASSAFARVLPLFIRAESRSAGLLAARHVRKSGVGGATCSRLLSLCWLCEFVREPTQPMGRGAAPPPLRSGVHLQEQLRHLRLGVARVLVLIILPGAVSAPAPLAHGCNCPPPSRFGTSGVAASGRCASAREHAVHHPRAARSSAMLSSRPVRFDGAPLRRAPGRPPASCGRLLSSFAARDGEQGEQGRLVGGRTARRPRPVRRRRRRRRRRRERRGRP